MNKLLMFLTFLAVGFACQEKNYSPDQLDDKEKEEVMYAMVRYYGRLPKKFASHENKFEGRFDAHYRKHALEHNLLAYHKDCNEREYFLISREAPSLFEKYVATGIVMERDEAENIVYYKEVFRTWKMREPELQIKSMMLFDRMVQGQDLRPYYPQHSGTEEYIEFPDAVNAYDTRTRRWLHSSLITGTAD
ncbi:hypothetical protein [Negadavirga shengliensis]|uniref:Uncharacterized protein n=1 Tax=Negadavirga shengliensis TaxID=1389218 RepID=A0ABV9T0P5_9BACT